MGMIHPERQWVSIIFLLVVIQHCVGADEVVAEHSYWERLTKAKSEVIAGVVLFLLTPIFLWTSEKYMVKYEQLVSRCQIALREVTNPNIVFRKYQSRPVLVKGTTSLEPHGSGLKDNDLGYVPDIAAVRLRRIVEMYQWKETKKEEDNGKRTIYSYHKEWSQLDSDSSSFQDPSHRNPRRQPDSYSSVTNADVVKIGGYRLIPRQVEMMHQWMPCALHSVPTASLTGYSHLQPHLEQPRSSYNMYANEKASSNMFGGSRYLIFKGTLQSPEVGTVRVSYDLIPEGGCVTTVGVQDRNTFRAFTHNDAERFSPFACLKGLRVCGDDSGSAQDSCCACCSWCQLVYLCMETVAGAVVGSDVLLLEERLVDIRTIFGDERSKLHWRMICVRLVCYMMLSIGVYLIMRPIAALLSFVPLLGSMISWALWIAAVIVGCVVGMLVSSSAWIMYRPHWLAALLIVSGGVMWVWGQTSRSVTIGKVTCALALVPFSCAVVRMLGNAMFAVQQRQLDEEVSEREMDGDMPSVARRKRSERTPLIETV